MAIQNIPHVHISFPVPKFRVPVLWNCTNLTCNNLVSVTISNQNYNIHLFLLFGCVRFPQMVIQSGIQNNVINWSCTFNAQWPVSSKLFRLWAEWKFPHDERSPLTSVKKQNFDSEQFGNKGPQTAIKTVNTVTAILHNRLLCFWKKFLFWTNISHTSQVQSLVKPLTPELNPSVQHRLTGFFNGDFASWTVHFINVSVKNQQTQLFIQFITYVW
jgi:hypothetical protein